MTSISERAGEYQIIPPEPDGQGSEVFAWKTDWGVGVESFRRFGYVRRLVVSAANPACQIAREAGRAITVDPLVDRASHCGFFEPSTRR